MPRVRVHKENAGCRECWPLCTRFLIDSLPGSDIVQHFPEQFVKAVARYGTWGLSTVFVFLKNLCDLQMSVFVVPQLVKGHHF